MAIKNFLTCSKFRNEYLVEEKGWLQLTNENTYSCYLKFLRSLLNQLKSDTRFSDMKIYDLEMTLFWNAEQLTKSAIERVKS